MTGAEICVHRLPRRECELCPRAGAQRSLRDRLDAMPPAELGELRQLFAVLAWLGDPRRGATYDGRVSVHSEVGLEGQLSQRVDDNGDPVGPPEVGADTAVYRRAREQARTALRRIIRQTRRTIERASEYPEAERCSACGQPK